MSPADALTCLAFSPDSQKVASGTARSGVTITRNGSESKQVGMLAVDTPVIVAWSHDGKRILSASLDNTLRCWNTTSSQPLGPLFQGHKEPILAASFLTDSSRAISLSRDGEVLIWETGSGEITQQQTLSKYAQTIFVAALSVDGTLLITSDGKEGIAWEIPTCVQIAHIPLPNIPLLQAAIIPNSLRQVVLAFGDMSFRIWDTRTTTSIHARFEGLHGDAIPLAMAVSPDGEVLVLEIDGIDDDHPTHFYDRKGKEFANPNIRCIHPFAFSPDGKSFAASHVSKDGPHKLVISSVREILGLGRISLDVPATTIPFDKGKQKQHSLPPGFLDELPRGSDSAESRVPATRRKGSRPFSRESHQSASLRSTGFKRRIRSLPKKMWKRIPHPRSRKARSSGTLGARSPATPGPSTRERRDPPLSRMWKRVRHPRSHNARSPEQVSVPHAQALSRVVASPRRRKTKNYPAKSSNEASQQPQPDVRRPDRHDRDAAGRSHGHDTTSEVRLDHAEGENGNAEAHGCCNVFWVWLCYKAF